MNRKHTWNKHKLNRTRPFHLAEVFHLSFEQPREFSRPIAACFWLFFCFRCLIIFWWFDLYKFKMRLSTIFTVFQNFFCRFDSTSDWFGLPLCVEQCNSPYELFSAGLSLFKGLIVIVWPEPKHISGLVCCCSQVLILKAPSHHRRFAEVVYVWAEMME